METKKDEKRSKLQGFLKGSRISVMSLGVGLILGGELTHLHPTKNIDPAYVNPKKVWMGLKLLNQEG